MLHKNQVQLLFTVCGLALILLFIYLLWLLLFGTADQSSQLNPLLHAGEYPIIYNLNQNLYSNPISCINIYTHSSTGWQAASCCSSC